MKLLLILLTVLAVVWLLRARRVPPPPRGGAAPGDATRALQTLARCAHCGMHLTSADSERHDGQSYCSAAHRRAGPRAPFGRR